MEHGPVRPPASALAARSVELGERVNRKTGEVRAVNTVDCGALNAALTQLSREPGYEFLKEGTRACLTQTLIDQDKAFKNFFEGRAKFPKFKGRFDKQAVRYHLDQRRIAQNYAAGSLLKLPKLGALKVRWSRIPTGTPKMATVSKDHSGRYFVSFSCEEFIKPLAATDRTVGVDLGICDVAVTSDGWKSGNPRHLKQRLRHLNRQQRALSRKQRAASGARSSVFAWLSFTLELPPVVPISCTRPRPPWCGGPMSLP